MATSTVMGTTTVKMVTTPTVDTPGTCLYVHAEGSSYVFGHLAEGTQRAFNNGHVAMGSTDHVFLSGTVNWDAIGGLFGYILTIANVIDTSKQQTDLLNAEKKAKGQKPLKVDLKESVGIHGGDNLCHGLAACRSVIMRQSVVASFHEQREDPRANDPANLDPDWSDKAIRVWKVPVRRARSSSPQKRRFASPDEDGSEKDVLKPPVGLSDPTVAQLMLNRTMFTERVGPDSYLYLRDLSLVKSTDMAFVRKGASLSLYKGPITDSDSAIPNPNQQVWVLPAAEKGYSQTEKCRKLRTASLPPTSYSETSMTYIVKCHPRRGKFNPTVALDLGVKKTDFKVLTRGESVQGANGVTVTPDMVLGDTQPGHGFIVADIESRDFLDSFMERSEWSSDELMEGIASMYWILGPGLATDVRIQKFVRDHPKMKHVFAASDTCPNRIALSGSAELQTKLRCVDPDRFSLLKYDNAVQGPSLEGLQVEPARQGSAIRLMPRLDLALEAPVPFVDLATAASSVSPSTLNMARKARNKVADVGFLRRLEEEEEVDMPSRDTEIIALGTGSSIPGRYRNVSGTLIRVPGHGSYLLDCGEGTLGQIRRLYGEEETAAILRDLKCIAISHLHADHHLGTPSITKAWYNATLDKSDARLAISCPWKYRILLEEVSQVEDIGFHRLRFVHDTRNGPDKAHVTAKDMDGDFGLASVKRIPVQHCSHSDAVQLEMKSGLRVAYSGDCRPSAEFASECRGAHLLVHECTFDDDMPDHAVKKQHSTLSEALGVARDMKARRTLLTHFSQRYVKADSLKRQGADTGEVLMAFDHMRVRLGDFKKAAMFQPAITQVMEMHI